jgi:nucleotide-binding universal stress UspA family protein
MKAFAPPSTIRTSKRLVEAAMDIRTILAAVSGGAASAGAIELACRLACRFGSHLEGYHVRLDPREMALVGADGFGTALSGDLVELTMRDAADASAGARRLFDVAVKRHALPACDAPPSPGTEAAPLRQASACWREETGHGATRVADRARFFDLLVLGRSSRVVDEPHSAAIEEALLASGRPVLIAPSAPPQAIGETVALAWNDSPQSARALAAAMPFLVTARAVHVLSVGDTRAAELIRHLGWYGVRATADAVYPVPGVGVGELLLAAAHEQDADLLVMGGYGHAPWREALFGGATRQVIGTSLLPLLLSH